MSKLTIDTGVSTSETIKSGFDDCNANFTELYNRQGPFNGNKAANFELHLAIKSAQVNLQYQNELFYISKVVAGALGGGNYTYTIEISVVTTFGLSGTKICSWTEIVGSLKTGLELIYVGQYSSSGRFFRIGINWGLLTAGTTYTAATYQEGGLYTVLSTSSVWPGGDNAEAGSLVQEIGSATTAVDGSYPLYWVNDGGGFDVTLDAIANVKGPINFKFTPGSGGTAFNIRCEGSEELDGKANTYLAIDTTDADKTTCFSLIPVVDRFLIVGDMTYITITPNP